LASGTFIPKDRCGGAVVEAGVEAAGAGIERRGDEPAV
jgi:hypothetical protein